MSGEVKDKSAEIKALLIAEGGVDIDERILGRITTPASGPGAGLTSFFLRFDGHRVRLGIKHNSRLKACLLYTSDAADDLLCVDLGGRRIIKKKNKYTKI